MIKFKSQPHLLNAKLTAIWAVSESGLGGLLHAIKIPFSGLFLGSFAVIIVTYLAHANTNKFKTIAQATLLVVIIKAMASPHSPPMAYVAVVFQGFLGALLYDTFGLNRFTAISFGALALFESAFQKILTLTIIFGMGLWDSIQKFFDGMQAQLQTDWISKLPWLFLILYGLLYLCIGAFAGNLAFKLPKKVLEHAKTQKLSDAIETANTGKTKRSKRKRLLLIIGLLVFATAVFIAMGLPNQALRIVLRTLAAIIFFLFVFNPLFKYLMKKWVQKEQKKQRQALNEIMSLMPTIKANVKLSQNLSASEPSLWKRSQRFILNWLSLSLYFDEDEQD